jgi:glutamate-1-semialdehyde 2,1-aminomutase
MFFSPSAPADYAEARRTDTERFARFFHAMLDRGVALAPGAYEILFPGLAHTDEIVDEILAAAESAAAAL